MTFPIAPRQLCGYMLALIAAAAGPAAAGPVPPAEVPVPTQLTLDPKAVSAAAGLHTIEADARLDGTPVRLRFAFVMPAARLPAGQRLPVVVCLSNQPGAAGRVPATAAGSTPIASFASLAPECPAGHTWAEPGTQELLRQLIDDMMADATLDAGHVCLTGYGPATADVWRVGAALADHVAAVAAIDGPAPADPAATVDALWHVGVYAVDSRARGPMAMALAGRPHRDYVARIDPRDDAAATAASVYADPSFWGWMLAQRRSSDTSPPPARPDGQHVHLGPPTVVQIAPRHVAVSFDPHALPTAPGFAFVPAKLVLEGKEMPFDFGLYLPPGYPHAAGYHGGPVPTLVNLHWREFFGGADNQVIQETLAKLLVRMPIELRHQGEFPYQPVLLTHVAPCICVMPHCPANTRFESTPGMAEAVGQLIDLVVPALHADPDRVFLTGVSYGGSSCWTVGEQIAPRLAGIVPCDGRRTSDPPATAAALHDVAVYISVGDRDGDFTNDARALSAALAAVGHPNVTYREIHGGNHFCFSSTYVDPAFWAWLEGQHRPPRPFSPAVAAATPMAGQVTLASATTPAPNPPPAPPAKVDPPKPAAPVPPTPAPVKVEPVKVDPPKPAAPPPPAKAEAAKVDPPKPVVVPQPAPQPPPLPANELALDPTRLPTTPGFHTVKVDGRLDGQPIRFRFGLILPADYGHEAQPWPVVMHLHNRGYIGGDGNGSVTDEGLPHLLARDNADGRATGQPPRNAIDLRHHAPFVCVAPQCPNGHTWDDPGMLVVLDQLLRFVVANCHADPERTYLTGFSFGGSNTWLVGSALAGDFAAIAPLDGRATPDPAATVAKLAHTGVYQVVGGIDNDFMPEAKRMVAALAAAPHADFAFHMVPGGNHWSYPAVYTDPVFWDWMFAHRLAVPIKPAAAPVAAAVVVPPSPPAPPPPPPGVFVKLDPAALPRRPGYAVVRPTVTMDGKPLSVPVGVWLPANFAHPSSPLPVIMSLHNRYAIGMDGETGALLGEGLPMILANGNPNRGQSGEVPLHPVNPATDVAFIGLFPQCPANQKWESAPMPEVLDKVVAAVLAGYGTAAADPDRVYLTGWSYGGSCTWAVATADPRRFAAIAVNDGRAMPDPAAAVKALHDVGVYLVVGENDGEFVDNERRMLDALSAARHPNFVHRTVAGAGHTAYQNTYADPAFWGWLLSQHRRH